MSCLAYAVPNGPVVVNIPTLGTSLPTAIHFGAQSRTGEYMSRWLSPECRLIESNPQKHVRMSTRASKRQRIGCLKSCRNTVPGGLVSTTRDRSPRVKTLRT
uniref:Uncharacterized protein n=1 Tax=Ananas comosus var. bracteatus TaxID=296719 RepID=A0A6V7QHY1_ANACO|nr:unnamed protein product [Ananas comosus var. bracteatus]